MAHWRRTYWTVWFANLITGIGMMSFLPFFPSLLQDMGLEDEGEIARWAGLLFGAAPLSATVMSPIWGALGDRFGRKLMVIRSMAAIALFVGLMGQVSSPLALFFLRIGQGVFSGFIPPSITLVSVSAPPERQGRVAADLQTALALGAIIGPLVGGVFAAAHAQRDVFLFVGIAAAVSGALVGLFAVENKGARQQRTEAFSWSGLGRGLARDVRQVWGNRSVRFAVCLLFFLQLGLGATNPVLELFVRDLIPAVGAEVSRWWSPFMPSAKTGDLVAVRAFATSLLFGGMAVANLVSLPLWGRIGDRFGYSRALSVCASGVVVSLAVQALAPGYFTLFFGRMLMGVSMAGAGPLAFGLAGAEIRAERRGGAFGVVFSARTFSVAFGGMAGGVLTSLLGIRGLMFASAAVIVLALAVLLRVRKNGTARSEPQ